MRIARRQVCCGTRAAPFLPQLLEQLDLYLLNFEESIVLLSQEVIDFFVQDAGFPARL
jgi:hypothetical protein